MFGDLNCGYGFGSFLGSLVHDVEHTVNPIFPVTDVTHALTHHQSGAGVALMPQESQEDMPLPPPPTQFHPMAVNTVHNHIHNHHHLHHIYAPQPAQSPPVGYGTDTTLLTHGMSYPNMDVRKTYADIDLAKAYAEISDEAAGVAYGFGMQWPHLPHWAIPVAA